MTRGFLVLAFMLCLSALASPVHAKPDDKLRVIEQQLSDQQKQAAALAETEQAASKNLSDLRAKLIQSTQTLQEKEAEQENLEDRLDDLAQQISEKSAHAAQERKDLAAMVSALMEIASRPPESLFLQNRQTQDHIHRSLLLQAILPRLREDAENAAQDLNALYDMQTQMAEQKRLVEASQANLQKQQHDMDQMIQTRQGFLQRTEQQKTDIAQHLAALSDEARDLRQLMAKVATQQSAKALRPATKDGVALKWPVAGQMRRPFGDKDADGVTSEGVTIAAPSGAPIVAPHAGRVVFAGPFRGYGQIMILQHANGYHSFLSGFGRIDAEMGQDVEAGEPLGVLPVKAGTKQELYFEWRRGDQPVDPTGGLGGKG